MREHFSQDLHSARAMTRRFKVIEVDDRDGIQIVKCSAGHNEVFEFPLRAQPHGLTGVPPVGSVGTALMIGGRPDTPIVLNLEHPDHRPRDKKPGEVVTYAQAGQTEHLDENGSKITSLPKDKSETVGGKKDTTVEGGDFVVKTPGGTHHVNP
ncbi:MAG: phage baseplate assembly protein [Pseudomonadota bacterium]